MGAMDRMKAGRYRSTDVFDARDVRPRYEVVSINFDQVKAPLKLSLC